MKKIIGLLITACVIVMGMSGIPAFASAAVAPVVQPSLKIIEFGVNASGVDKPSNRNAEFVRMVNTTGAALDVEGWTLHDAYQSHAGDWGNRYTFKATDLPAGSPFNVAGRFTVPDGGQVYIYNGSGADTTPGNGTAAIYRNFKHVYNNGGDTIYVRNAAGLVTHFVIYSPYRTRVG